MLNMDHTYGYCKRILYISQDAAILCNFLLTMFWANGSAETHLTKEKTKTNLWLFRIPGPKVRNFLIGSFRLREKDIWCIMLGEDHVQMERGLNRQKHEFTKWSDSTQNQK